MRGISWQRYPPLAPHWGGVHEALVRSAKNAIKRVLDASEKRKLMRDFELSTLYAEVTSFLNNRPLTYCSDDPKDGYLTPNHFLMPGRHFVDDRNPPRSQDASCYTDSYRRVQYLANQVWDTWLREYLPALTTRAKWQSQERDAQVGDVVLILDANLPRDHWRMGRIEEVYVGKNGRVRSAKVRTVKARAYDKDGTLVSTSSEVTFVERAVTKLCLLQAADQAPASLRTAAKDQD